MAGTTVADLNGLFKQVYGDEVIELVPEFAIIRKRTKFVRNDQKSGNFYNQPVVVQDEQGASYAPAGSGNFDLNPASTLHMENAQILGSQIAFKAQMDQEAASRAVSGGASAFESATKLQVANVLKAHTKRVELALLYGQSPTGLGVADTSVNTNTTTTVLQFTTASWSDGLWSGMTQTKLNFFKSSDNSLINTNAAIVVSKVDTTNKKLTVTGNQTDISALDSHLGSGDAYCRFYVGTGSLQATPSATVSEAAGIDKILTNTSSIFGIDAATYDLWKANLYNAGGALTLAKLQDAIAQAVGRGLDEDVTVFVNPKTWANLESDQAALRMYDSSYSKDKVENGSKSITFYSQNGTMEIVAHPFVKEGEAFILPLDQLVRTGATEVTFNIPGQTDSYFTAQENNMGFFYKSYSNQALLINTPAKCIKIYGITNSVS